MLVKWGVMVWVVYLAVEKINPGLFPEQVKTKELRVDCSSVNQNGGKE